MKALQKVPVEQPKSDPESAPQHVQKIGMDDRIAAAAAALVFGLPTALLIWLFLLAAGKLAHVTLPHHYAIPTIWAVLTACGFLFPRSTDEIFGNLWVRLLLGIWILIVALYVVMSAR